MDSESTSEKRLHLSEFWHVIRSRHLLLLISFSAVFLAVTLFTLLTPREYRGRVQLEIFAPQAANQEGADPASPANEDAQDRFTQTQFEALRSQKTLSQVAAKLELEDLWGLPDTASAVERLQEKVQVQQIKGTNMIGIDVYDKNPQLAADIANAVAQSYRERRLMATQQLQENTLSAVKTHLENQEAKVEEARAQMEKYLVDEETTAMALSNSMSPAPDEMSAVALAEAQKEVETLQTRVDELKQLNLEDYLQRASALNLADSSLKELLPKYFNLRLSLRSMQDSGLGPNHPKVVSIQNQITTTQSMLGSVADNIQKNLESDLELAQAHFDRLSAAQKDRKDKLSNPQFAAAQSTFRQELAVLEQMRASYTLEQAEGPGAPILEVHEDAVPAKTPARPQVFFNLGLGALVGLAIALGLTFFLEYLDTSLKTVDEVERHLQLPVLAVIPSGVGVLHKEPEESPDCEAYRILRTNIDFNRPGPKANAITVTSGSAGEGKSTTLVNLAYVCAQSGLNTLIVDADLRRPRMHSIFNMENERGLTEYLQEEASLQEVVAQTNVDHLYLLPSGTLPPDTSGLLSSPRLSDLLDDVKRRFDLVLVDAPPILGVSDAAVLANGVDMTMIVMQHRRIPRNMMLSVKQAVDTAGGRVLGVVMNNVDIRSNSQYSYYTNYYTYFSPERKAAKAKDPNRYVAPTDQEGLA